jgi:two-component sensor histidine kinase/PAS domain-containing protein
MTEGGARSPADGDQRLVGAFDVLLQPVVYDSRKGARSDAIESDDRFLRELDETLRGLQDPSTLFVTVSTKLGRHLGLQRCVFCDIDAERDEIVIHPGYETDAPSIAGTSPLDTFGTDAKEWILAGRIIVTTDTMTDPRTKDRYESAYAPLRMRATAAVPLLRSGVCVGALAVACSTPRNWTARDLAVLHAVATKTWLYIDITERFAGEQALRENEARYRRLFHDSPTALCEQDFSLVKAYLDELAASGVTDLPAHLRSHPEVVAAAAERVRFTEVNDATLAMYEAENREEILANWPKLFGREMVQVFVEELCFLLEGKGSLFTARTATRTLKGRKNEIAFRLTVLPGSEQTWSKLVASIFDMTAYHEAERELHAALREKEVLLKEVHHRVKNNLQVISSLLNLQARYVEDEATRAVFASSQSRVQSIAMVHEKLHHSRELSHVKLGEYLKTLVGELLSAHSAAERGITSIIDVADLNLSVDVAIPCGLIVNELVTNALKHAFRERSSGTVTVRAKRVGVPPRIELSVADDGAGLPQREGTEPPATLGLDLVFTFAEQLGAELEIARSGGTTFVLRFQGEDA